MNKNEIVEFIGNDYIYERGFDCFRSGKVIKFNKTADRITALVQDSSRNVCSVVIDLDYKDNFLTDVNCTCEFFEENYEASCKHIAAVLIYDYEKNKNNTPLENPVIADKETFCPDKIVNLSTCKKEMNNFFNANLIAENPFNTINSFIKTSNIDQTKNSSKERYRLIFVIDVINPYKDYRDFFNPASDSNWYIYPEMQYIKKNGSFGKFSKFNFNKITEPVTENERILLLRITDQTKTNDNLINHFEFLLDNEIPNLCTKDFIGYQPVSFEEIKKINLKFKLHSASSSFNNNEINFEPDIEIIGKNDNKIESVDLDTQVIFNGLTSIVIDRSGKVFYKLNHELIFSSLKYARGKRNFTSNKIEELKNFLNDKSGDEIDVSFNSRSIRIIHTIPKPFIEIDDFLNCILRFDYNGRETTDELIEDLLIIGEKDEEYIAANRNKEYEHKILRYLLNRYENIFAHIYYDHKFSILNMKMIEFLTKYGLEIIDQGIEIRLKGDKNKISKNPGKFSIHVDSKIDWFDLKVNFMDNEGNLSEIEINPDTINYGLIKTRNTYTIISKKEIKKLQMLYGEGITASGELKVSKYRFDIIDELYADIKNKENTEIQAITKISKKLNNFDKIENHPLPQKFNCTLRNYQHAGFNWLHFLNEFKLNGCLADDMGLGKTVQVLTLLEKLKEEKKLFTSLIIVPVNTITNWEVEIKKWTQNLTYLLHFGLMRKKDIEHIKKHDLIVVSYHTLRNDIELFNKTDYYYIILDEAQNIKNFESLAFKAVKTLKSEYRLSVTGTPIENNTTELWSQMDFLNHGLLGSIYEFKNKFTKPIENYNDKVATEALKKRIFPFILRRKKDDVLIDLPPKSEIVLFSEMEEEQRIVYEQYREYYKALISGKIEKDGIEKSAIEIFTALLKLRQIALFPFLVDEKFKNISSCKFEHFKNIAEEILSEKHKILIFSQFIEPLKTIEKFITEKSIKYAYIDGSISAEKRKLEIDSFQNDENVKIFLLSLKAGGVGINLTSADYVILFDPWWNPAVESQAIDRSHRIGQTKKVIAYKMIVKNTVEEKILELQEKKKNLVREIITTEGSFFKSLSKNDIINLFM